MQTFQHIPVWVAFLLVGLIALGLLQTRTRQIPQKRLLGIQVGLTVLTLVGVTQQWRSTPWLALSLLSWAAACLAMTWGLGLGAAPSGASYSAATRRFTVPGSWLPFALFMAIFACKFAVGVVTAITPDTLRTIYAAAMISALYGAFSEVLNGRALRLFKLKNAS